MINSAARHVSQVLPGYRYWLVEFTLHFNEVVVFTKLVGILETAYSVAQGRVLVLIRQLDAQWNALASPTDTPIFRWLDGAAAREVAGAEILAGNVRPPVHVWALGPHRAPPRGAAA
jgi:hypothetical protein